MMNNTSTAMNLNLDNFAPATIADFPHKANAKTPELYNKKFNLEQQIAALTRELNLVNENLEITAKKEDNEFKKHIETHNYLSAMVIATDGKILADPNGDGVRGILGYKNSKAIQDHKGNWFATITDMCDWYGINVTTFKARINILKWSLEDALTTPIRSGGYGKTAPKKGSPTYYDRKRKGYPEEVCMFSAREFANWKREQKVKAKANKVNEEKKVGELMNIG